MKFVFFLLGQTVMGFSLALILTSILWIHIQYPASCWWAGRCSGTSGFDDCAFSFGYPELTTALHDEDGAACNDHAECSIDRALPRPFSKDVPIRPEPVPFDLAPFSASNPYDAPGTIGTGGL